MQPLQALAEKFTYVHSVNAEEAKSQENFSGFQTKVITSDNKRHAILGMLTRFKVSADIDYRQQIIQDLSLEFKKDDIFYRSKFFTNLLVWLLDLDDHPDVKISSDRKFRLGKQYKDVPAIVEYQKKNYPIKIDVYVDADESKVKATVNTIFDPEYFGVSIPFYWPIRIEPAVHSFAELKIKRKSLQLSKK